MDRKVTIHIGYSATLVVSLHTHGNTNQRVGILVNYETSDFHQFLRQGSRTGNHQ